MVGRLATSMMSGDSTCASRSALAVSIDATSTVALTVVVSSVATVVGYLIGEVHLAALSIGVSVITLGERIERGRLPIATARRASRAPRRGRRLKKR